jgi:hypothetical protein
MSDRIIVLQKVISQRTQPPVGLRIWSDGLVQRPAADNPLPAATERLDKDRDLRWEDDRRLSRSQIEAVQEAIRQVGFFALPPVMLINYCKEDPGTAIWTANVDGQTARVVVFDPRPRRSAELDRLSAVLDEILGKTSGN